MSYSAQPAKKRKIDFSDAFAVIVGAENGTKKTYHIPHAILTKSSGFFRAACKRTWKEGQNKVINLHDAEPEYFDVYLQFLHTGDIVPTYDDLNSMAEDELDSPRWSKTIKILVEAYLLSDMLLDISSKNAVLDFVIGLCSKTRRVPTDCSFYADLPETSPLRRLILDYLFFAIIDDATLKATIARSPTYAIDVAVRAMGVAKTGVFPVHPASAPRCTYHEHDDDDDTPACA